MHKDIICQATLEKMKILNDKLQHLQIQIFIIASCQAKHRTGKSLTFNVFVYGTLKKGFSNHHYLKNATFLGTRRTLSN